MPPPEDWLLGNKETTTHLSGHKIPKTLRKVFLQKTAGFEDFARMVPELKNAHSSWKEKNPDYLIEYFDLKLCREYLANYFHPIFLRAFDCIEAFAGKNNLFRMAVIYREGGWYSDWKQECVKENLLNLLSNDTSYNTSKGLVVFKDKWSRDGAVQNGFFGATARHPVIEETLKMIFHNVQSKDYPDNVFWTTGVGVFGMALNFTIHKKLVNKSNIVLGRYTKKNVYWYKGKPIIDHKCKNCGKSQDWANGNNYKKLHAENHYYCEDRQSLFQTI